MAGVKEGRGTYYYKNGAIYAGDFKGGKKSGHGVLTYGNGDRYEGHAPVFLSCGKQRKFIFLIQVVQR